MEALVIGALVAFVVSMSGLAVFASRTSLEQRFRRTDRTPIARLTENRHHKIVGRVRPFGTTLTAPLSGRACVLYEVVVESKTEARAFYQPTREKAAVPFWVEEDDVRVFIDPTFVGTWLVYALSGETGLLRRASKSLERFMRSHKRSLESEWGKRSFIYREGTIAEGDRVAIIGIPRHEADPDVGRELVGYRTTPTRTRMLSTKSRPVLVSNAPSAMD